MVRRRPDPDPLALRASAALRAALLRTGRSARGRAVLQAGSVENFVEGVDADYDSIRRMARAADRVRL